MAAARSIPCNGWARLTPICPTPQPVSDQEAIGPPPALPTPLWTICELRPTWPEQARPSGLTVIGIERVLFGSDFWIDTHGPKSSSFNARLRAMGAIPADALIVKGCWSATLPSGSSSVAAPSICTVSGQLAGVWVTRRAEAVFKATVAVSVLWPCGGATVRVPDHALASHWKGAWQLPANDEKSCSGLPNAVCSVQATGVVVLTLRSRPHFEH